MRSPPFIVENNPKATAHRTANLRRFFSELVWHLAPPLTFFAAMLLFYPSWNSFWLIYDEGYNLMKAMELARGYALYSQIWSDQAPLLTYLLAGLFRLQGDGIILSRILILLFSCVLLWAVVQYLRLVWGKLHALAGAVLLVILPNFLLVSAAVLVGQPSLAFAALSMLALAAWHLRRKPVYIVLSATALSLSLLTKLFTGFLVPIFLLGLIAGEYVQGGKKIDWRKAVNPALLWSLALFGITLGLGLLMVSPAGVVQLIQPHVSAARATDYPSNTQLLSIHYFLRPAWPVLLAALVGILFAWKKQRWLMMVPLAWMVSAYLILLVHKPVWWHHQMLVTIPAAILAAGAVGESLHMLLQVIQNPSSPRNSWPLLAAGLVSLALVCVVRIPQVDFFSQNTEAINAEERVPTEDRFMRKILQFAPQTSWMITDMPMYPFRAGVLMPPNLVVISWKRFAAGDLAEADIVEAMREYRPEQVLFGRFSFPTVDQYLGEHYRVVMENRTMKLYIRGDLQK